MNVTIGTRALGWAVAQPLRSHAVPLLFSRANSTPPSWRSALSPGTRARIPNVLTWARVVAVPVLGGVVLTPPLSYHPPVAASIFGVAALTDLLDGYLARRWKVESPMGIFLDPVADKLLVAVALVALVARFPTIAVIVPACVIVTREIFVSALREWMALRGASAVVKVSVWGKIKTASQMVALAILLAVSYLSTWYARAALALLAFAAFLTAASAADYTRAALAALAKMNTPNGNDPVQSAQDSALSEASPIESQPQSAS